MNKGGRTIKTKEIRKIPRNIFILITKTKSYWLYQFSLINSDLTQNPSDKNKKIIHMIFPNKTEENHNKYANIYY